MWLGLLPPKLWQWHWLSKDRSHLTMYTHVKKHKGVCTGWDGLETGESKCTNVSGQPGRRKKAPRANSHTPAEESRRRTTRNVLCFMLCLLLLQCCTGMFQCTLRSTQSRLFPAWVVWHCNSQRILPKSSSYFTFTLTTSNESEIPLREKSVTLAPNWLGAEFETASVIHSQCPACFSFNTF